jgi:NAD(P)-dependent dehydrogenase (short-subunit alcohol dehydrogenase family)
MTTQARITTPFTRESTAAEVLAGVDLTGKRAIVTGGGSGIGVETARALAGAGADVTVAVRNTEAARATVGEFAAVAPLDLSDQASVAAFAAAWTGPLDILVGNAGVMAVRELTRTPEGWELQFATNHLGHFALAAGLHGALAAAGDARLVSVSSAAHLRSPIVFDDIHFRERPYHPWSAYGQSKTANALFAVEATRRWAADGIVANALMPGAIRSNLQRHTSDTEMDAMLADRGGLESVQWKTPEQGAATSVLLAASPLVAGVGGRYFEDADEAEPHREGVDGGVAAHALDPAAAERLWEASVEMLARR